MRWVFPLIGALLVAIAALGAYNVYAERPEWEAVGRQLACAGAGPHCRPELARLARTPLGQSYVYAVGNAQVQVDCRKSLIIFGLLRCERLRDVTFAPLGQESKR